MVIAEGSATGSDCALDSREMGCHHIGISLDDHSSPRLCDLLLGEIDPVEQLALLVDRSLWRIEVLGSLILFIGGEFACPEADHVTT